MQEVPGNQPIELSWMGDTRAIDGKRAVLCKCIDVDDDGLKG